MIEKNNKELHPNVDRISLQHSRARHCRYLVRSIFEKVYDEKTGTENAINKLI